MATSTQQPPAQASPRTAASLENRYYSYLRAQGYSTEAALLDVLREYLPYFAGHAHIADLGCGHGEFLALLQEAGHRVAGVDLDPAMVAHCRAQGFAVDEGDAVAWLQARPATFDGIFSSNVIEHLPADEAARWLAASFTALRPGGVLLFATPNPESAIVQLHEFWRDATHVRMYSRQLLEFLLVDSGFVGVQSGENEQARWEGVQSMLGALDTALPAAPLPAEVGEPAPLPPAPPASASWRERMAWRVSSLVYAKFSAAWIEPLRADIARQTQLLEQQRAALLAVQNQLAAVQERLQRLAGAQRFLYPSREIFVLGFKPTVDARAAAQSVQSQQSQPLPAQSLDS